VAALHAREVDLLVVDGAEHATEAAATLVEQLVRRDLTLTVVVAARAPLQIAGETVLPLDGLDLDSGPDSDAHRLFADRLGIDLADADAADLDRIDAVVRSTAGIPILLELAAATFDPDRPAGPPGVAFSMGGAIGDAVALVEPAAVELFEAIAFMPTGLGVGAVVDVVGDDLLSRRLLHQLRSVRLVVAGTTPGGRRYRVLDPVAEAVVAALSSERRNRIAASLAGCLATRFRAFRPTASGPLHHELLDDLDDERDGVLHLLDHLVGVGDADAALALFVACAAYLWHRAVVDPTEALVLRAVDLVPEGSTMAATALCELAEVLSDSFRVGVLVERYETAYAAASDPKLRAELAMWCALGRGVTGNLARADEMIAVARDLVAGDVRLECHHAQLSAYRQAAGGDIAGSTIGLRAVAERFAVAGDSGNASSCYYLAAVVGDLVDAPDVLADVEAARAHALALGADRMLPRLDYLEGAVRSREIVDDAVVPFLLDAGDRLEASGSLRMAAQIRRNVALATLDDDPERARSLLVPAVAQLLDVDLAMAGLGLAGIARLTRNRSRRSSLAATATAWWSAPRIPIAASDLRAWERLGMPAAGSAPTSSTGAAVLSVDEVRALLTGM
jgi:hypothetical protein